MFKPVSRFMPEIGSPERTVKFNEKLFWTGIALVLYLVMAEVPLYDIGLSGGTQLTYLRIIFASNQGSLMELGIGPIVTAGLILQLLAGAGMIGFDSSDPDDRALFTTATKALTLVMIIVQASAYLYGGMLGTGLDIRVSIVIFLELVAAELLLMLLDEMVQKWGIGSGISLFILAGVAQIILWDGLFTGPLMSDGKYFGAIPALVQTIMNGQSFWGVFVRSGNLPSILGLIVTIVTFLVIIYLQDVRVEIPVAYASYRGFRGRYPIRLLYVSNLPVIFASALFANVYYISQILWKSWGSGNFLVQILGNYRMPGANEGTSPILIGGLAYFVTSPGGPLAVLADPVRALIYLGIMVAFCVIFSLTWLEVGGLDPKTVAKQLMDAGMHIPGFRRSEKPIESILKRYIPAVTIFGGFLVGLIAAVTNFFGVFSTGVGILLSVGILYQYYEQLMKERISDMYPALRGLLGG
jgi:preprotein translocase SecY subunit